MRLSFRKGLYTVILIHSVRDPEPGTYLGAALRSGLLTPGLDVRRCILGFPQSGPGAPCELCVASRHGGTSLLYVGKLFTGFNAFKCLQFTQESRDYMLMMTWRA